MFRANSSQLNPLQVHYTGNCAGDFGSLANHLRDDMMAANKQQALIRLQGCLSARNVEVTRFGGQINNAHHAAMGLIMNLYNVVLTIPDNVRANFAFLPTPNRFIVDIETGGSATVYANRVVQGRQGGRRKSTRKHRKTTRKHRKTRRHH